MKKDYLYTEKHNLYWSYTKICGKKIKDIVGYVTNNEYGEPTFKISKVIFEDNSSQFVEGEHDFPYMTEDNEQAQKIIQEIYAEEKSNEK